MSWKKGPFDKYKAGFDLKRQGGSGFSKSTTANSPEEIQKRQEEANLSSQPVEFPRHLYTPEGAQTIDIRKVCLVAAGDTDEILRFKAPQGSITRFTHYGIFNDGALEDDFQFLPLVDGRRAFPYHGDPAEDFRISLGLGPDLTNNSMIEATLALSPTQEIVWSAVNNSAVAVTMGVRMKGYLDFSQRMVQTRYGG
jgi:hypothetical protein